MLSCQLKGSICQKTLILLLLENLLAYLVNCNIEQKVKNRMKIAFSSKTNNLIYNRHNFDIALI